jgi:hypothetical protein
VNAKICLILRHKNEKQTNKLKYKIYISLILLLLTTSEKSVAQLSIKDSAINIHIIGVHYSALWPGGDMADRYGRANTIGLKYAYKHNSNFFAEFSYGFIWGNEVVETNMLDGIKTIGGYLIDNQGLLTIVDMELRGHSFFLGAGKIFPVVGPNPNSGIIFSVHGGFVQHNIKFSHQSISVPQIQDDYIKGYDRLCNGFAIKENLGYINLSNVNLSNWNVSFECIQAFTESRRSWDIDMHQANTKKRVDLLFGLNIEICFPIFSRAPEEFYYR